LHDELADVPAAQPKRDGFPEARRRLGAIVQGLVREADIVVTGGVIGIGGDRLLEETDRHLIALERGAPALPVHGEAPAVHEARL
jgi:hypothetical protein